MAGRGCRVGRIAHAAPKVSADEDISMIGTRADLRSSQNSLSPE